jgi:hypothetical protein
MKPHKHAELIKAWADGAIIQYYSHDDEWFDVIKNSPSWKEDQKYRIKPKSKPNFIEIFWSEKQKCWIEVTWDAETNKIKSAGVLR